MTSALPKLLGVAFGLALTAALPARADSVRMPTAPVAASAPARLPRHGMSMAAVIKAYGEPRLRHATVGGHAPKHPPITRWDYAGFSVIFERHTVIDTVVPGHPPKVFHRGQLNAG